jgi:hypothetical protein
MNNTTAEMVAGVEILLGGKVRVEHWDDKLEILTRQEYDRRNILVGAPNPKPEMAAEQLQELVLRLERERTACLHNMERCRRFGNRRHGDMEEVAASCYEKALGWASQARFGKLKVTK